MLQANQGRRVFADDGTFAFPPRVRRVWIDVGAHLLQTTGRQFLDHQDIGLIAIEPMPKPWTYWPRDDRLIGLPVAIYLDRGWRDFKIAAWEMASSLSDPAPDNPNMDKRRTVEVIQVPALDSHFDVAVLQIAGDPVSFNAFVDDVVTAPVHVPEHVRDTVAIAPEKFALAADAADYLAAIASGRPPTDSIRLDDCYRVALFRKRQRGSDTGKATTDYADIRRLVALQYGVVGLLVSRRSVIRCAVLLSLVSGLHSVPLVFD